MKNLKILFFAGLILGFVLGTLANSEYLRNIKASLFDWDNNIINANETIQTAEESKNLIAVMDDLGIKQTYLSGAPKEIISFKDEKGFSNYNENNQEILKAVKNYPDRFKAFCVINTADENKLTKVQECIAQGGSGIRLYSGQEFFYQEQYPLDEESMKYVYKYAEEQGLPIFFHVNLHNYKDQFIKVLDQFPKLKIVCSQFCVYTTELQELGEMLTKYPNLYVDTSFGHKDYVAKNFQRISENITKFKEFFSNYSDRILFATNNVITNYEGKDEKWIKDLYSNYKDLLERESYTLTLQDSSEKEFNGLNLTQEILEKIYYKNAEKLFATSVAE
ncbi:MAG: Amidohydrolase 2 [Candidatus Peregrinibacteria bacterium GW2011_GWA2_33_10]|nr:MAG: Amidohydrolase 2 [Candidatus Peregrinibacteria bacterium GW2011_GWA2_33_10]